MKTIALIFLMLTTFVYLGCKKSATSDTEIYGKWKLIETLADPGDGSGKYIPVEGAAKYVLLEESGKISGEAFPEAISFRIVDSIRMEITFKDRKDPISYWYKRSGDILNINPPCIEACGNRFRRD